MSAHDETFKVPAYSPALSRAAISVLDGSNIEIFKEVFDLATRFGAIREIDFIRKETASFNIWPARIAQICIEEAKIKTLETLSVATLSCCNAPVKFENINIQISEKILHDAAHMSSIIEQLKLPFPNELSPAQLTLAKVHLLDRARHLHLAAKERISDVLPRLLETIRAAQKQGNSSDSISGKLAFWAANRAPLLPR